MSSCCTQPMVMASASMSKLISNRLPTTPAFAAPNFRGLSHPVPLIMRSRYSVVSTSSASGTGGAASVPSESDNSPAPAPEGFLGWVQAQRRKSAALREKLVSLGPAAILAYGLFDGVSYTIAFSIAFLGYEARTGMNPTANVADIVKICILMWAGNNVTRPFRLAGAAALAPFTDRLMIRMQERLRLPNKLVAFFMLTASVAAVCLSIVGSLFFSRWIQG